MFNVAMICSHLYGMVMLNDITLSNFELFVAGFVSLSSCNGFVVNVICKENENITQSKHIRC